MLRRSGSAFLKFAITLGILLVAPLPDFVTSAQSDFGFRFTYGPCSSRETLNTFTGVFSRDAGQPTFVPIPLVLPEAQMTRIAEAIQTIGFFDLPVVFEGWSPGPNGEIMTTAHHWTYRLEVKNAGRTHAITWADGTTPTTAQAGRLREMFQMMIGFIREHPDVKRLPGRYPC